MPTMFEFDRAKLIASVGGPAILLLLCILLQLAQSAYPDLFMYDRALLAGGQWWRLLSGHLVHTNSAHLLLNGVAIVALWFVFGQSRLLGKRHPVVAYLELTVVLSLLISGGLWLWFPEVQVYYGLSGVLHGLFCFAAVSELFQRRWSGGLLLIGCFVKVGWELVAGPSAATASLIEADVAVSSHLLGTLFGTLIGVIVGVSTRRQKPE
ncbi:rhombosortase [Microbulbifer sp. Q7]|uniref:rhombosortase n=1 Tax=Microbulbifer sp. Q7 TaxID=1785091 RepID=UPI0009ECF1EB|nr:rhombosortase [Microbulbifer sp. Q7]